MTIDDGLSQRIITGISSDSLGSIHSFEGQELKSTLLKDSYDSKFPLVESNGKILVPDKNNCIWLINKGELIQDDKLCLLDSYDGYVLQFIVGDNSLDVLMQDSLEYIYRRYEATEKEISLISEHTFYHDHKILTALYVEDGQLLFVNDRDELHNIQSEKLIYKLNGEPFARSFVPIILKHKSTSSLYFSLHTRAGIYRYKDGKVETINRNGFIGSYGRDKKGNLLIGVEAKTYLYMDELFLVDDQDEITDWSDLLKINNRLITYYGVDFEKAMLLGTHNGLYYYQFELGGMTHLMKFDKVAEGGFGYIVRSFTQGHNGNIVAAIESGSRITELIDGQAIENRSLQENFGYGLNWIDYVVEEDQYYLGQFQRDRSSVLKNYNPKTGEQSEIELPLILERFHLLEDEIWVTGRYNLEGRILRIDRANNQVTSMFEEHLKTKMVRSSYFTDEVYLFGTRAGLVIYDVASGKIDQELLEETKELSISNIRQYENRYLIGTYNDGIHVYNRDFEFVKNIVVGSDPPSNTVASIERDHHGNYWVSTFQGID